jgi:hypothetical protein
MTQPLGLARRLGGRGTVFRVGDGRVSSFLRLAGGATHPAGLLFFLLLLTT